MGPGTTIGTMESQLSTTCSATKPSGIKSRTYIQVPHRQTFCRSTRFSRVLLASVLSPTYWLLAHRYQVPGLQFRVDCARLAFHLLFERKPQISYRDIYGLLTCPVDSTRYFEFQFVWNALSRVAISRFLDVSSPRLFPIILAMKKPDLVCDLLNPDPTDLSSTGDLVEALKLRNRCHLHCCLIKDAQFEPSSFDVVTSISVVEHIPQETEAVQQMWRFLKPKGRLFLTLPCAAQSSEQYINRNEYGLLIPEENGYFFFQRLYDQQLLEQRIFSVTGQPRRQTIYGEKLAGKLRRTLDRKIADPSYPYWREPYMMGQNFRYFEDLAELPGEGVIALEFEKSE
jgi:SAM-dependent methyltransferase